MPIYRSEFEIQRMVICWADLMTKVYPCLKYLNSSQNGVKFSNPISAKNAKLSGMRKGVPDLSLIYYNGTYYGLHIELKSKKGRPTEDQLDFLDHLNKQQHYAKIAYSFDEAINIIKDYLDNKLD
jgi:hypothetical protein